MSADADFLEIFRDEANERLDSMVDTLLALEGGSGPDAIDALFRDAHTIKGGAGMLGLDDVARSRTRSRTSSRRCATGVSGRAR